MKPQNAGNRSSSVDQRGRTRNPFGVMDVPNPNDQEVLEFATRAKLAGTSDEENSKVTRKMQRYGRPPATRSGPHLQCAKAKAVRASRATEP
jgi:hypothetical protein